MSNHVIGLALILAGVALLVGLLASMCTGAKKPPRFQRVPAAPRPPKPYTEMTADEAAAFRTKYEEWQKMRDLIEAENAKRADEAVKNRNFTDRLCAAVNKQWQKSRAIREARMRASEERKSRTRDWWAEERRKFMSEWYALRAWMEYHFRPTPKPRKEPEVAAAAPSPAAAPAAKSGEAAEAFERLVKAVKDSRASFSLVMLIIGLLGAVLFAPRITGWSNPLLSIAVGAIAVAVVWSFFNNQLRPLGEIPLEDLSPEEARLMAEQAEARVKLRKLREELAGKPPSAAELLKKEHEKLDLEAKMARLTIDLKYLRAGKYPPSRSKKGKGKTDSDESEEESEE
jgi:hypothetical protein